MRTWGIVHPGALTRGPAVNYVSTIRIELDCRTLSCCGEVGVVLEKLCHQCESHLGVAKNVSSLLPSVPSLPSHTPSPHSCLSSGSSSVLSPCKELWVRLPGPKIQIFGQIFNDQCLSSSGLLSSSECWQGLQPPPRRAGGRGFPTPKGTGRTLASS